MRGLLAGSLVLACIAGAPAHAQTWDALRASRHLACGVVAELDDWNDEDIHGDLSALGAAMCRAVAIAALGGAEGLDVHSFPAEPEALAGLKGGKVALVMGISPGITTAAAYGVGFGPPIYFDAQRIMAPSDGGIADIDDLRGKLICDRGNTDPARTLRDELDARAITHERQEHSEQGEMDGAIAVRRCDAGTGMESRLAESRAGFHALVSDFAFLPERLAVAPVVPAYVAGDLKFALVVDATISALVEAEALGITKANVAEAAARRDMRAQRLLGGDPAVGEALGLPPDWAVKVIADSGNYGEIFARTVGEPYHLDRGLNRPWTEGGLMQPTPLR